MTPLVENGNGPLNGFWKFVMSSCVSMIALVGRLAGGGDAGGLRLVVDRAAGRDALDHLVVADGVLDQVVRDRLRGLPVPRARAAVGLAAVTGNCGSVALSVKPTRRPLEIAVRPVPVVASQLVVLQNSYVGLTVGWLLSGIQAIEPTGSVVMKPPSPAGVLLRNQPSVAPSPSDVHAGAAGVVDLDLEVRAGRDRRGRRDHELVRGALHALLRGGGADSARRPAGSGWSR